MKPSTYFFYHVELSDKVMSDDKLSYGELLDSIFGCKSSKLAFFSREAKVTAVYTNCHLNQIHPDKDSISCKIFLKWGHKQFIIKKLNRKFSPAKHKFSFKYVSQTLAILKIFRFFPVRPFVT